MLATGCQQDARNIRRFPGAYLFVDECHATGFLGKTGRGTDEHCGVLGRVDIINSTLGKALGGATGAFPTRAPETLHAIVPELSHVV